MASSPTTPSAAIPLTDLEKRIWSDIDWAEHNPDLQEKCAGEWVAIHERRLVAHGKDRDQVVREAATALQLPFEEFAVWPIQDPADLLSDTPLSAPES